MQTSKDTRIEWIEVDFGQEEKPRTREWPVVKGKYCPKCGWLEPVDSVECFRCGYRFDIGEDLKKFKFFELPPPEFQFIDPPPSLLSKKGLVTEEHYRLLQELARALLIPGFETLISLPHLNIKHFPHQIETAIKVLKEMRGRAILADEVGLGKTIEAGIVTKELIMRGLVESVLIIVPSPLVEQWIGEMKVKFSLDFVRGDRTIDWASENFIVTSLELARREPYSEQITSRSWDLLIVDEAHKLKNRSSLSHRFVSRIKKKYALFLTAVPIQNDLMELYALITLVKPGMLGTVRQFKRNFAIGGDPRKVKDPSKLKLILREVMIRHRRVDVDVKLPPRKVGTYYLKPYEDELELYTDFTNTLRQEYRKQTVRAHQLSLMTLQKEFSSSPLTFALAAEKVVQSTYFGDEFVEKLKDFIRRAVQIKSFRKLEVLKEVLSTFEGKKLIFTSFVNTARFLKDELQNSGYKVALLYGGQSWKKRKEQIDFFQEEADVMISTEVGGEGFNFQFCQVGINWDLPWNPMRIEQRIGRIHRIGQEKEIYIINLVLSNTVEEKVVEVLARKLKLFESVIGELDMILGRIPGEKLEQWLGDIVLGSATDKEMDEKLEQLYRKIEENRKKYIEARRLTNELLA